MPTRRPFLILAILACTLCLASVATAQAIFEEYEEGALAFDYAQWPFGGLTGSFAADGPIWNDDLSFPNGSSGCGGGILGSVADTTQAIAIGAVANANGTHDVGVVFVTFPEGPALGTYDVDMTTFSAGFVWLNDVANLTIPEQGDDYQAWFDSLQASHRFGATSGTINVTSVGEDGFSGTFDGMMGEPDLFILLTISNGSFGVNNVAAAPVPHVSSAMQMAAAPNPFNPQTTIKLSLARPDRLSLNVYDVAGRKVAVLFQGMVDDGDHQWIWDGKDQRGIQQSGGVYFCRAEGSNWSRSTKLILVP